MAGTGVYRGWNPSTGTLAASTQVSDDYHRLSAKYGSLVLGGFAAAGALRVIGTIEVGLPGLQIGGSGLALAGGGTYGGGLVIGGGTITSTQAIGGVGTLFGGWMFMNADGFLKAEISRAQSEMNGHREGAQRYEEFARDLAERENWAGYNDMMDLADEVWSRYIDAAELAKALVKLLFKAR